MQAWTCAPWVLFGLSCTHACCYLLKILWQLRTVQFANHRDVLYKAHYICGHLTLWICCNTSIGDEISTAYIMLTYVMISRLKFSPLTYPWLWICDHHWNLWLFHGNVQLEFWNQIKHQWSQITLNSITEALQRAPWSIISHGNWMDFLPFTHHVFPITFINSIICIPRVFKFL